MRDIIKLLPDSVANQIAAGEVIQRPASVVKELMENAIDAGANDINVVIRDSGRTLVQVIDNGCGMSETDARLAFERHATSKIGSADDLFAIRTKGFRGEALASIAAVSMTELKTRREEDETGTLVVISNSRVEKQEPCPCASGSVFSVKNLFYNVPARRKFLKSDSTEFRHIITEFQRASLPHPDIRFCLTHNDQEIYRLLPGNHRQRIISLFGKHYSQDLVSVETATSIVTINGFAGKPENARRSPGEQFFFINSRFIRHPYLHRAVMEAYQGILPAEAVPAYFIFMTADPNMIDVNIHPSKTEVKFEDERSVWQILLASVRESLGRFNIVPSIDFGPEGAVDIPVMTGNKSVPPTPHIEVDGTFNPFERGEYNREPVKWDGRRERDNADKWESLFTITARSGDRPEQAGGQEEEVRHRSFFQVKNRYIMCPVISGIMLIDQRRAHERILYEKYLSLQGGEQMPVQATIFPAEIELNPADLVILDEISDTLKTLGFDITAGKNGSIRIKGYPAGSHTSDPAEMLETVISEYKRTLNDPSVGARERIAMSMARASAIPYGHTLSGSEMEELFDLLFACSLPNYSPSGRPVMNIITTEELDRRFS